MKRLKVIPKITFITSIVNLKWIDQCRHYLETEVKTPYEWLVLDNTDKPHLSFAQANNYLASQVDTEFICFLNDDVIFLGDPLPKMLEEMKDSKIGLIGTKLLFPNRLIQHGGVGFGLSKGYIAPGHMCAGEADIGQVDIRNYCPVTFAIALTRTSLYRELGGLSEAYYNGIEDLDYCFKVLDSKHECLYLPTVDIIHVAHGSRTTSKDHYNWELFKAKWPKHLTYLISQSKKGGV